MLSANKSIIKKLYKAKKHIAFAMAIAMLAGLIYSFIIKPVYVSIAEVYPTNLSAYSEESQTEQLLQFLQSNEIKEYLIKKLQLTKHYKIDTTKQNYLQKIRATLDEKIKIDKTKYESVEIKASDFSADTARLLVVETINAVNWLIDKEHKQKYLETVKNSQIYLSIKKHEVDSTQHLLNELNEKYGILNVGMQLKTAVQNQFKIQNGGGNTSLSDFSKIIEQLKGIEKQGKENSVSTLFADMNNYSLENGKLYSYFSNQVDKWVSATDEYQKNLSEYLKQNTFVTMASEPIVPSEPLWPKPWIVVLISGLTTFVLACLYFVFIDNVRETYAEIVSE